MENVHRFELPCDLSTLRRSVERGELDSALGDPMRILVTALGSRMEQGPVSIYVCSDDRDRTARNQFCLALSLALQAFVEDRIVVDCDFLYPGLDGEVPQRDGLGFLDLLLYGTSLGSIRQQTQGQIPVIGTGSFPVGKKSPFVMDAFVATRRYLTANAKCVLFTGPALGDDDGVHPIVEHVDLPVVVSVGRSFGSGALDAIEGRVVDSESDSVWCLRLVQPATTAAGATEVSSDEVDEVLEINSALDEPGDETSPEPPPAPEPEPRIPVDEPEAPVAEPEDPEPEPAIVLPATGPPVSPEPGVGAHPGVGGER